jgi:hypothetical protein
MRIQPVITGAGLILVAVTAAACSGASGSAAGNPQAAATSANSVAAGSTAGGSSGSVATKRLNVCAMMPAATASQITGTKFTKAKPSSVEGVIFACEYDGPDTALLQVSVETTNGRLVMNGDVSTLKTVGHPPTLISGVGDAAYSEPDPHGNAGAIGSAAAGAYGAVFGQVYIKIGGFTYVDAQQGKQIVDLLHSKL